MNATLPCTGMCRQLAAVVFCLIIALYTCLYCLHGAMLIGSDDFTHHFAHHKPLASDDFTHHFAHDKPLASDDFTHHVPRI